MSGTSAPAPSVTIAVRLSVPVTQAGTVAFSLALAEHVVVTESLAVTGGDGRPLVPTPVVMRHGTRMHVLDAPAGDLYIWYDALSRRADPTARAVHPDDRLEYLRPSRYCPADKIAGVAAGEFGGVDGDAETVMAITDWINERIVYVTAATDAEDDALHPLLARQGVCRDFAHLGIALCRASGIPARYASVYAPGLEPMDVHAVFEASIDGHWRMFDGTRLAPRTSMVRIATGRDAADTALLSPLRAQLGAPELEVTVTADPDLPQDNGTDLVTLA